MDLDSECVITDKDIFPEYGDDLEINLELEKASNDPKQLLETIDNLSPAAKKAFKRRVINSHTQYGAVSMFKGVEDIAFAKAKANARNQIDRIHFLVLECENEIASVYESLLETRTILAKATAEMETLEKELDLQIPLERKNTNAFKKNTKAFDGTDSKKVRELKELYRKQKSIFEDANCKIPKLENELIPLRHDLAILQLKEKDLQSLDLKIEQCDLQEKIEKDIIDKYQIKVNSHRKNILLERTKKALEKDAFIKAEEKNFKRQTWEALKTKRSHLMDLLRSDMHEMEEKRRLEFQRQQNEKLKISRALSALKAKVSKIKKKDSQNLVLISKLKNEDFNSEFNPKDSEIITQTRLKLKVKEAAILNKQNQTMRDIEAGKMEILNKIMNEDKQVLKTSKSKPKIKETPQIIPKLEISQETFVDTPKKIRHHLPPPNHKIVPKENPLENLNGPPFIFSKPKVEFIDYDANARYSQEIFIINSSRRVNSYQLLKFPTELADVFSIKWDSPGFINAGLKTKAVIFFHPPTNLFDKEVGGDIIFQAQWGGTFSLNVSCFKKKSVPKIISVHGIGYETTDFITAKDINSLSKTAALNENFNLEIDFGTCVEGDLKRLNIKFYNQGALPVSYKIERLEDATDSFNTVTKKSGEMLPYSKYDIAIRFKPDIIEVKGSGTTISPNEMTSNFKIEFSDGNIFFVKCKGTRISSPMQVDRQLIDFKLCKVESTYRQQIFLKNNLRKMTKIWITMDSMVNSNPDTFLVETNDLGELEVVPALAFVQSQEPFPIWISIVPSRKAFNDLKNEETGFRIQFKINYLQQDGSSNWIPIVLFGELTTTDIILKSIDENNQLYFGRISTLEAKDLSLQIENTSRLSQAVLINSLDSYFTLINNTDVDGIDGTIFLAPKEIVRRIVRFAPKSIGHRETHFTATNSWNKTFKISAQGFGIWPPLKFSDSEYSFPKTAYGSERPISFKMKPNVEENSHISDYYFQFGTPSLIKYECNNIETHLNYAIKKDDEQILKIFPLKGMFSGKKDLSIEAVISPPSFGINSNDLNKEEKTMTTDPNFTSLNSILCNKEPCKLTFIIPCVISTNVSEEDRMRLFLLGKGLTDSKNPTVDSKAEKESMILLKLSAEITKPDIIVLDSHIVNFGCVNKDYKVIKTIIVQNISEIPVQIKCTGLSALGSFSLVNALRTIEPGSTFKIKISFKPDATTKYQEYFELITSLTLIKIKLTGEGIIPEINVEPDLKKLLFGDVLLGDSAVKTLKLKNPKDFDTTCAFDLVSCITSGRFGFVIDNRSFFEISTNRVVIPAKSEIDLSIKFKPLFESSNYNETLKINIVGNNEPITILLHGKCWESTVFTSGYDIHPIEYTDRHLSGPLPEDEVNIQKINTGIDNYLDDTGAIDDNSISILSKSSCKKVIRFETITCYWRKTGNEWILDSKELILFNIKPEETKLDVGKRAGDCKYSIESFDGSFEYDEIMKDYIITKSKPKTSNIYFSFQTSTGVLEYGSSISIMVSPIDPVKNPWNDCISQWITCGQNGFDCYNEVAEDAELQKSDELSVEIPKTAQPVPIHVKFQNDLNIMQQMQKNCNITQPEIVENYFRLVVKGGVRLSEPKCPLNFDNRVWIIKVVSKVADSHQI